MKPLDPKDESLQIVRVVNGWVIRPFHFSRDGYGIDFTHVATSPDKLCALIEEWARGQQDLPKG